ncbi:deazaflavin-dependent oxidoreductase, nitroreductase family [Sinosporangium album]|uniref:Deazaflavin-dependent oxidoreductase, nitroreductase family n=1 Tax=Sinosporangium album TaxID=504805 RepID=A0A1G8J1X4_9ACTN|nr:nitroreductase family deazaflavin-dependent oxidoreductase [Sinosporangium album]SDI25121.1 deazaflavin-dependent oxidoreductase, nitroreductase family [Sinosporangium album]
MAHFAEKPSGWSRTFYRAPIWLYRAGLGWILGNRFAFLATRGRNSGSRRETVVEVADLDRYSGTVYVVSGWGERSDWYRNLRAAPAVEIRVGSRRLEAPHHRRLGPAETLALLIRYGDAHPWEWKYLAPRLGLDGIPTRPDEVEHVRAIAFSPTAPESSIGPGKESAAHERVRAGENRHDGRKV